MQVTLEYTAKIKSLLLSYALVSEILKDNEIHF